MRHIIYILFLSNIIALSAFAGSNYAYTQYSPLYGYDSNIGYENSNLQGYALYVPAGTTCQGLLSQDLSSQSAVAGQNVSLILKDDFKYRNKTVAPAGSVIYGTVSGVQKAGYGNKNAKMMIRFTSIITPYGNTIPINAIVATSDYTGILKGEPAKAPETENSNENIIETDAEVETIKRNKNKGAPIFISAKSPINIYFTQPITYTAQ